MSEVKPDITYRVLPEHYEAALARESERWQDGRASRAVWKGRRVWRLHRWDASRALYRLLACHNERLMRERGQLVRCDACGGWMVAGAACCPACLSSPAAATEAAHAA